MRRKRFEFIASVWHVVTGRCPFHPGFCRDVSCNIVFAIRLLSADVTMLARTVATTRAPNHDFYPSREHDYVRETGVRVTRVGKTTTSLPKRRSSYKRLRLVAFRFHSCNKVSVDCNRVIPSLTTRSSLSMLVRRAIREIVYRSSSFLRYVRTIGNTRRVTYRYQRTYSLRTYATNMDRKLARSRISKERRRIQNRLELEKRAWKKRKRSIIGVESSWCGFPREHDARNGRSGPAFILVYCPCSAVGIFPVVAIVRRVRDRCRRANKSSLCVGLRAI